MPTVRVRYEEIGPIERGDAEQVAQRDDPNELCRVVISVALHGDPNWAEPFVTALARHRDPTVRGNAILGFGHLARLHHHLDLDQVIPLVRAALDDDDSHVRNQANAARDDIEHFLRVQVDSSPGA